MTRRMDIFSFDEGKRRKVRMEEQTLVKCESVGIKKRIDDQKTFEKRTLQMR